MSDTKLYLNNPKIHDHLNHTDLKLLKFLYNNKGTPVDYDSIIKEVWGSAFYCDGIIRQAIYHLRKSLANAEFTDIRIECDRKSKAYVLRE